MTCDEIQGLIDDYLRWLHNSISLEKVDTSCEITTPFLDRHNDAIVLYLERNGNEIILSDDGYTLANLAMSGVEMTPRRKQMLQTMLNGFGVELSNDELLVRVGRTDFPKKKHNLIQAILSVNDLFLVAHDVVRGLFLEEVRKFLSSNDIPFVSSVKISGNSGMDHTIDILIPPTQKHPERIIQAIGHPEKQTIITRVLFPYLDIESRRPTKVIMFAFLNDQEKFNPDLIGYIQKAGVSPILWSERGEILDALTLY